jgi:hypothetical protein
MEGKLMKIEWAASAETITYTIDDRTVSSANIADYQDGVTPDKDDFHKGSFSIAVRLGRFNDMFLISAFRHDGNNICSKHLFVRLRDGRDITIEYLGNVADRDLYGFTFGRNGDLYNVYGIRSSDFEFVFDPRAPRTGRTRNPNTVIHHGQFQDMDVLDGGCR